EPAVDLLAHVFRLRNGGVPELPQLAVPDRVRQAIEMAVRQRLEPRLRANKRHRFKPGHWCLLLPSLRANGPRECALDDRLREAIPNNNFTSGLPCRYAPRNDDIIYSKNSAAGRAVATPSRR